MSWMDVPFPPRLAFGLECDPGWEDEIARTIAGFETRNLNWEDALHRYNATFAVRTASDHTLIREHFHMARGRVHSWPLLDPLDNRVTVSQGIAIEAESSSNGGSFQLYKRYGSGAFAYDRKITRPISVLVYRSGVLQTLTTDYDLDSETGVVTFVDADSDLGADDITWSGQFFVPCRYDTKNLPTVITNKSNGELTVSSSDIPILEVRE